MTTAAVSNPLSGHIVRFPGAIPTENWMTDRMLWSDLFGAIWPWDQQPTPKSEAQEDAMMALSQYREEGFFAECLVDHEAFAPNNLQALGHRTAAVRDWVSHFPAEDGKGVPASTTPPTRTSTSTSSGRTSPMSSLPPEWRPLRTGTSSSCAAEPRPRT
jgi:hypothetical protein